MKLLLICLFAVHIASVVCTYRRNGASSRNSVSFLLRKVCVEVTGLKEEVTGLKREITGLNEDIAGLKEENSALNDRVSATEEAAPTSAFSTYGYTSYVNDVVVWAMPTLNTGSHYNNTTGKYCAEHNGTYLFHLNLYKFPLANTIGCYLLKDSKIETGESLSYASVPSETSNHAFYESSTTAITHLDQGDCVYVGNCDNYMNNWSDVTTFTGTLLSVDSD